MGVKVSTLSNLQLKLGQYVTWLDVWSAKVSENVGGRGNLLNVMKQYHNICP